MFYQCVVASVITYAVVCWGSSASKTDVHRLEKLIRKVSLCGGHQPGPSGDGGREELLATLDNATHPLRTVISNQWSLFSDRLLLSKSRTNTLKNSFVHWVGGGRTNHCWIGE